MESTSIKQQYKIILLGNRSVGKSSLIHYLKKKEFLEYMKGTMGTEFCQYALPISENESVSLHIWDTAGEDKFKGINQIYFRGSAGCVFVYDITDEKSFLALEHWIELLDEYKEEGKYVVGILIGNKMDLSDDRKVTQYDAMEFARKNKLCYMETSCKTGLNVEQSFVQLAQEINRVVKDQSNNKHDEKIESITITPGKSLNSSKISTNDNNNDQGKGCC